MQKKNRGGEKGYQGIDISQVSVAPGHIRKKITDTASLKSTISDVGLLQPVLVREDKGRYVVVDGARRLQALKELEVPELIIGRDVIVDVEETEADARFKQLIANVQREDLDDIELGHAFVTLKEEYGYQYTEIAEIIGKTPHYVSSKVGLAKRLTPEVQGLVAGDREGAKCIRNTLSCDGGDDPYLMNVNVVEDIARLPAGIQRRAYEVIRKNEMDKKEALKYLRSVKQEPEVLRIAEDAGGLMAAYSTYSREKQIFPEKELSRHLKKLDNDLDKLSMTIKAGPVDREKIAPALEALIQRLSLLYSEVKGQNISQRAFV